MQNRTSRAAVDAARARAEARFKIPAEHQTEAAKAMAEVDAAKAAESAKTAKLRALRLAKEEAERRVAEPATQDPASRPR